MPSIAILASKYNGGCKVTSLQGYLVPFWVSLPLQLPQDTSEENWRNIFATNVDGIFHTVRAAYPLLKRSRSSKVVITSSIGGEMAGSGGSQNDVGWREHPLPAAQTGSVQHARAQGAFGS